MFLPMIFGMHNINYSTICRPSQNSPHEHIQSNDSTDDPESHENRGVGSMNPPGSTELPTQKKLFTQYTPKPRDF